MGWVLKPVRNRLLSKCQWLEPQRWSQNSTRQETELDPPRFYARLSARSAVICFGPQRFGRKMPQVCKTDYFLILFRSDDNTFLDPGISWLRGLAINAFGSMATQCWQWCLGINCFAAGGCPSTDSTTDEEVHVNHQDMNMCQNSRWPDSQIWVIS